MAIQYSVAVNNAKLDAIETTIGISAILKIRTGAAPANCAAADAGTVLATLSLPSDWMAGAASAAKAKSGTCVRYEWCWKVRASYPIRKAGCRHSIVNRLSQRSIACWYRRY